MWWVIEKHYENGRLDFTRHIGEYDTGEAAQQAMEEHLCKHYTTVVINNHRGIGSFLTEPTNLSIVEINI
jgi:hypothetical protein